MTQRERERERRKERWGEDVKRRDIEKGYWGNREKY